MRVTRSDPDGHGRPSSELPACGSAPLPRGSPRVGVKVQRVFPHSVLSASRVFPHGVCGREGAGVSSPELGRIHRS